MSPEEARRESIPKEVVMALQCHWMMLFKHITVLVIGVGMFTILVWFAILMREIAPMTGAFLILVGLIILMVSIHVFFVFFFEWRISTIFITPQWLIEVHFLSFAQDDVTYIEVNKINKIDKKKHGIIRNIFNYGEIILSVAGVGKNVEYRNIPNPSKVAALIESLFRMKNV